MVVGIYARVSTEEQARQGFSLSDQLRECRKKAGTKQVIEYVDEGVSGEVLDRPELIRLRKDLRTGIITEVVCFDPDRLSRKLQNQLIIADEIERRAKLNFVNGDYAKTPEGILFFQMRGAIAEFEKAKITERMSRGRREKARQGLIVKDPKTYGYDFCKDTRQLVINEREAVIVRLIFDLFTGRVNRQVKGINGIAHYLNSQGIPTKKNVGVWHKQVVRQILLNKTYMGEFYQNRWNCEGRHYNKFKDDEDKIPMKERPKDEQIMVPVPTIIEKDQFEYAQRLLDEARRRWAGTSKRSYLLRGLLRCGECGNTMTGRKSRNWGKDVFEYTDIKNTAGAKFKGCGKRVKMEELDALVWETVLNWLNNPEALAEEQNDCVTSFEEAEIERINQRLDAIKAGRSRLLNLLADNDVLGDAGERDTREKLRQFKEEEERLIGDLTKVQERLNDQLVSESELQKNVVQEASEYYLSKKGELSHEEKQFIIRSVVREIQILGDEIKVFGF